MAFCFGGKETRKHISELYDSDWGPLGYAILSPIAVNWKCSVMLLVALLPKHCVFGVREQHCDIISSLYLELTTRCLGVYPSLWFLSQKCDVIYGHRTDITPYCAFCSCCNEEPHCVLDLAHCLTTNNFAGSCIDILKTHITGRSRCRSM